MAFVGQAITWSIVFTDSAGAATDPTTARFFLRESVDGEEEQWTYNGSALEGTHYPTGAAPIVRNSQGNYSLRWVTRKPERHTGFWHGAGNDVDQTSQTTVFVRHSDVETIEG